MATNENLIPDHIEKKIAEYLKANNLPNTPNNRYDGAALIWNRIMELAEHEELEPFYLIYMKYLSTVLVEESLAALHGCN